MQPALLGLSWNQLLGAVISVAAVVAIIFGLFHLQRRRREARKERPPQTEKLLRPPGYSALLKIDELTDNLLFTLTQALAAGVVFGIGAGSFYPAITGILLHRFTLGQLLQADNKHVLFAAALLTVVALLWCIGSLRVFLRDANAMRNWRFGLRGEQAVAEKLAHPALAAAGYVVFHDVPSNAKWNIDHVVVGPGGVFVLETKARARRKPTRAQKDSEVFFDGQTLEFPWCDDRKAARQAEANARWVREFIAAFPPKGIPVEPVIVVPGWYVTPRGKYPIKVMNATYLVSYLKGMKPLFTRAQLDPVIARLDERCRTLEF
jgi:MFS family permease